MGGVYYPTLSGWETEAHRAHIICLESQSKWQRGDKKGGFVTWQRATATSAPTNGTRHVSHRKPLSVLAREAPVGAAGGLGQPYQAVALAGPRAAGSTLVVAAVAGGPAAAAP